MFSRHALAMELIKLEQYPEALEAMIALLAVDENHSGTYYHLGKLLEKAGRIDEAIAVYEEGIQFCQRLAAHNDLRELKGALVLIKEDDL